jgi:hypothetical protein
LYDLKPTETAEPAVSLSFFASHFDRMALMIRLQDLSEPPLQCKYGAGPV